MTGGPASRSALGAFRLLAALQVVTALGLVVFWYAFFFGGAFPRSELAPLIPHFEGYRRWEEAFVVPDTILALGLAVSAVLLWRGEGLLVAAVATGGLMFLGVLDLTYGLSSGFFDVRHGFVTEVKLSAAGALASALVSVLLLRWAATEEPGRGQGKV